MAFSPGQTRYGYHRANTHPSRLERRTWGNIGQDVEASQRFETEGESWVEISSQPSSSSSSSIDYRRATALGQRARRSPSSQDEYDESSSEDDDRVLTGTADCIHTATRNGGKTSPRLQMIGLGTSNVRFPSPSDEEGDEDDEDEEGTALGIAPLEQFTPQPPVTETPRGTHRERQRDSYSPPNSRTQRVSETSHRAANDAALRASLTTLLSCAQAARGLPKPAYTGPSTGTRGGHEVQEFRMLPEAEVFGTVATTAAAQAQAQAPGSRLQKSPSTRPRSSATASADDRDQAKSKEKRKSAASQAKSAKKKNRASAHVHSTNNGAEVHQVLTQTVSPTLLTWFVSAGVVVFVSVVGFGAGYAMGFEAGREEGRVLGGREVVRVRRFRWGTAT